MKETCYVFPCVYLFYIPPTISAHPYNHSAASAGALELLTVYSTSNLPRTLAAAEQDGFRIVGASSSVPRGRDSEESSYQQLYNLPDLPAVNYQEQPTLIVLGSEGHGLRNLVAKSCTEFVRIPSGVQQPFANDDDDNGDNDETGVAGVDSLNVSVTGGILLWHFLNSASAGS